jgi:hypothetical protein
MVGLFDYFFTRAVSALVGHSTKFPEKAAECFRCGTKNSVTNNEQETSLGAEIAELTCSQTSSDRHAAYDAGQESFRDICETAR